MSNIDKQALRERYSAKPIPKCHICGTEMTVQRISASRITYGCTGATYDDKGCHYAAGRSIADDHYEQSRVTVVDVSDPEVLALLDELGHVDLLVLDEVGIQKDSQHEKIILNQIIDRRLASMKPVGVLTNLNYDELARTLGERVVDRLKMDSGMWVNFDWGSYRKNVSHLRLVK